MIEEADRRQAVEAAVASARIEGVVLEPETLALMEAYAAGEIDADTMIERALRLWGPQRKSPPG